MPMKTKNMRRDGWKRVLRRDVRLEDWAWRGWKGKIALIRIHEVTAPLTVTVNGRPVRIADAGYAWLQIAPEGQFEWLTAMFDAEGRLAEIYIDLTDGNVTDTENPWFRDMYLDYAMAGGDVEELDRDELEEALRSGDVTEEQYRRTLAEGEKTRKALESGGSALAGLVEAEYARMTRQYAGKPEKERQT